ncbi:NAD(P)-binding protein [Massarina eburnea CBS 473.64]|uniref:NAD(P)-binding protein n=1 Tax=Massarina eburnea CBS 473.64 TaxID=1395130 RepID=A0A6A6S3S1_9PLEO|nr:NAD(P)-binding protein [Massarina eburnea CBS 473.64]
MSHQESSSLATDQQAIEQLLNRPTLQTTPFTALQTAEDVATILSSDIAGKTVVITGVSPSGIGAEAARVIHKHNPKLLVLASRSTKNIDATITAIGGAGSSNVKGVELDLADLESVRKAAAEILEQTSVVDVLINNAGIMMLPEFQTTRQGVEMQFGTNHLGHFLLTNLLMPALLQSSQGASVVNVSSAGHHAGNVPFEDINFDNGKTYEPFPAYGGSKTANILFTVSLAAKLKSKGLRSFALDPGAVIGTELSRTMSLETKAAMGAWNPDGTPSEKIPWITVAHGASSYIVTGFATSIPEHNGKAFVKNNVDTTVAPYSLDPEGAEKLWVLSEKLVGQEFAY